MSYFAHILVLALSKLRKSQGLSHPEGKFVADDVTSLQMPPKPHEQEWSPLLKHCAESLSRRPA